jgi:hypothetical protein
MGISTKNIVCTALDENGNVVSVDDIANSFEKLGEFLDIFCPRDRFVMDLPDSMSFYTISSNPVGLR